jgi:hypothetical protein
LNFGNFRAGPYDYELKVNGRHTAFITNDSFSLGLNMLSGIPYRFELLRLFDSRTVLRGDLKLGPGEITNVSYQESIPYSIRFDGNLMPEGYTSAADGGLIFNYYIGDCSRGFGANIAVVSGSRDFNLEIRENEPGNGAKSLHFSGGSGGWYYLNVNAPVIKRCSTNISIIRLRVKSVAPITNYIVNAGDGKNECFSYRLFPLSEGKWVTLSIPVNKMVSWPSNQPPNVSVTGSFKPPLNFIDIFSGDRSGFDVYIESMDLVE